MKRYVLESAQENQRLDKQAELRHYSLHTELQSVLLQGSERVLDAGCGTGVLGRYLKARYPKINYTGIDLSVERLKDAKNLNPQDFNFFPVDLFRQEDYQVLKQPVDMVFNRYVMHHLRDHATVLKNFHNVLRPGGTLCIVDIDGIFVNVGTTNKQLQSEITKIAENFGGDLHAARLLPSLEHTGFRR